MPLNMPHSDYLQRENVESRFMKTMEASSRPRRTEKSNPICERDSPLKTHAFDAFYHLRSMETFQREIPPNINNSVFFL